MQSIFFPAILFVIVTVVYWYLQLNTGFFSQHYFTQIGFLFLNGITGVWLFYSLFRAGQSSTVWQIIFGAFVIFLAAVALLLAMIKLFFRPGDRARSLYALSRTQTLFTSPVKRFTLNTEDGVKIQTVYLRGEQPRKQAIIVCHGGGRNKDIEANISTCELLFEDYDVFTFDFRGHQESGGKWTGDGASKYDVKAVVDHARHQGYEKIGVVGWSFGAWSAMIEAAEFHNVDTIVAAAPPPRDMREVKMTRPLFEWGYKPLALPARILVTVFRGVRIGRYDSHPSLMDYVDRVSPIPLLIVCNEYDRTIGLEVEHFRELFEKAKEPKKFHVLKGKGHIYDWPNTLNFLNLMRAWLAETMQCGD